MLLQNQEVGTSESSSTFTLTSTQQKPKFQRRCIAIHVSESAPQKPALTLPLEDREQGLDAVLQVDHHVYIIAMAQTKMKESYFSRSRRKMAPRPGVLRGSTR